jgi:hypothetical protein
MKDKRKLEALDKQEKALIKRYKATKNDIKRYYLSKQIEEIAKNKWELVNAT